MPPKAKAAEPKPMSKKALALQAALDNAVKEAQKAYKQHERLRASADEVEKSHREYLFLDEIVTRERLKEEKQRYRAAVADLKVEEQFAFATYAKHDHWEHIAEASRLPDVYSEADINDFLSSWRSRQAANDQFVPETVVVASRARDGTQDTKLIFVRGEQRLAPQKRQALMKEELQQCYDAYELAEKIKDAQDTYRSVGFTALAHKTAPSAAVLEEVYLQLRNTFDFVSTHTLRFYDQIINTDDGETVMRTASAANPVIKFGLWVKTKDVTRSFTSLVFSDIEVRLDPKQNSLPKLPKMLGLSKENIAVRAVQLAFDPYSCYRSRCSQYYALGCTIKIDLLTFDERPRYNGEWLLREETDESHRLRVEEYPPRTAEARVEDPALRISFEVPHCIVLRQPSLFIGKWNQEMCEWELCSGATLGAPFGPTARFTENPRRATFIASELAQFAVLHETVFDALYEGWSLKPFDSSRILFTLEGRRRNDTTDREFRFLLEDATCRLLSPEDEELAGLRAASWRPAVLLRKLKQAGFNFLVRDEEACFLERVLPKSRQLEQKAYADMAQFSQFFTLASSHHNKHGEDADMALFRVSKRWLRPGEADETFDIPTSDDLWHSVRYRTDDCAFACFTEMEQTTNLNLLEGAETHYNLYGLLTPVEGEETLREHLLNTNYLLRRCVLEFLQLVRPLTWG
ncbi:hypothetical protein LSCM1_02438 [Leishmania martiniquensis]|uniref:Cyclic nucleotide-binding domain-containing protein n=1 Tax=Leishmania martiniquensis TaxID=1580590 RepID=A0A836KJX8_9TRYP|nr:hypothetical protein LSCM1_02438 [Leishmania martiniquensis]